MFILLNLLEHGDELLELVDLIDDEVTLFLKVLGLVGKLLLVFEEGL
jgi:hypothetical protein